jgi:hypothetical protein
MTNDNSNDPEAAEEAKVTLAAIPTADDPLGSTIMNHWR